MARIRTVKPEFWTDEKTGTLSGDATKVMLALLNHADDYGVIEYAPLELCARILPFREGSVRESFERPLDEIKAKRLIECFEWAGRPYLFVRNFQKHQRINRPSKPLLPDFDKHPNPAQYMSAHESAASDSLSTHAGKDRKGKEGIGVEWNGVERNGSEGKGNGNGYAPSAAAPSAPRAPGDEEPTLGRDFSLADVAEEVGVHLEREPPRRPLSSPQEIEARRVRSKAQLEAIMTDEERIEADRIRREGFR